MSDKGYLSNRIENAAAKLADDGIDFGEKRILFGLIKIEDKDRKAFKLAIEFLDDKVIGKNPNLEVKAEIDLIVSFIETKNVQGFIDHVADLLTGVIKLNLGSYERQIYLGFLMLISGFIGQTFEKTQKLIDEANK